jgi:hypothetical protein
MIRDLHVRSVRGGKPFHHTGTPGAPAPRRARKPPRRPSPCPASRRGGGAGHGVEVPWLAQISCGARAAWSTPRDAAFSLAGVPHASGREGLGRGASTVARSTSRGGRRAAPSSASAHAVTAQDASSGISGLVSSRLHAPMRMDGLRLSCLQETSRPPTSTEVGKA